jgi:hypothetical protein
VSEHVWDPFENILIQGLGTLNLNTVPSRIQYSTE